MNESKATRYQRTRRRERVAGVVASATVLISLVCSSGARRLADFSLSATSSVAPTLRTVVAIALFVSIVVVLWEIVTCAVVWWLRATGQRTSAPTAGAAMWLAAAAGHAQAALIALVGAWLASGIIMAAMIVAPRVWWICAGALLAAVLASVLRFGPALLPALGDVKPVSRRSLMSALREIARRSGIAVSDIVEWRVEDDAPATALVAGTGRHRRVFVASHLVREWSDDEIAVVVAHELAHHVYGDLWRSLALDAVVLSAGLWAAGQSLMWWSAPLGVSAAGDVAALPHVALVTAAMWLVATPLRLAQSRAQERRADRFALTMTGEPQAFGSALRRLSARHLAEERPSQLARWFFHRHPPVAERLAVAERFATDQATRCS